MKPCFACGKPAPVTFDHKDLFASWVSANQVICPWRARFEGVKERLKWASLDETDTGAHPKCSLEWAIREENFDERYPLVDEAVALLDKKD